MTQPQPLLAPILSRLGACNEPDPPNNAVAWAGKRRASRTAYHACKRGDWLLWLAARVGVDWRLVILSVCDCAEARGVDLAPPNNFHMRVLETVRKWCAGKASFFELSDVACAAHDVASLGNHTDEGGAAFAAYLAANAAYVAAAYGLRNAALPNTVADVYVFLDDVSQRRLADLVRARIPWETMRKSLMAPHGCGVKDD